MKRYTVIVLAAAWYVILVLIVLMLMLLVRLACPSMSMELYLVHKFQQKISNMETRDESSVLAYGGGGGGG